MVVLNATKDTYRLASLVVTSIRAHVHSADLKTVDTLQRHSLPKCPVDAYGVVSRRNGSMSVRFSILQQ